MDMTNIEKTAANSLAAAPNSPAKPAASAAAIAPSGNVDALPSQLVGAMLAWYAEMHRDLPWRRTRDPYAILVSEIMLQQTRVETVLGRYESFLDRFPTIAALAAAPLDDVLAEWSGLGYYRRPRRLHALANEVVDNHGGEIPDTLDELLDLPGLGPYTAAAVGSIAFGIPALSVDGNVGRIMCRIGGIEDDFRRAPVRRRLETMAADALRAHAPGNVNQAIMELGARVCTSRSPSCDECPCASYCEAHARGIEELIPPANRQKVEAVAEHAAVVEDGGRFLMLRGQRPSLVADMWEFPTLDSRLAGKAGRSRAAPDNRTSKAALGRYLTSLGWTVDLGPKIGEIRHGMTNRRIACCVYEAQLTPNSSATAAPASKAGVVCEPDPSAPESGWFTIEEATALPLAASARKTLSSLLDADLTTPRTPH